MPATPSPNLNDQAILAADALFQNRVREALIATCIAIASEATTTAYHYARVRLTVQIMTNTASPNPWFQLFAYAVATDATCISDATAAGATPLTAANMDAQQALVTDAHINSAISGQFNAFLNPSN